MIFTPKANHILSFFTLIGISVFKEFLFGNEIFNIKQTNTY